MTTNTLQKIEIFHLEFLRALVRVVPLSSFMLKGGGNLRFFFGSIRFSEDMDLDASEIPVHVLKERVMRILTSSGLTDTLQTYGISEIQPPDIQRAKQKDTVQRFKVHLLTSAGEDLSTKVEFSRRGFDTPIRSESVSPPLMAGYKMAPLIIPHYTALAALRQKIQALVTRRQPEPRDVFDIHVLSTQPDIHDGNPLEGFTESDLSTARQRLFDMEYEHYRDAVISFLGLEDRAAYDSPEIWDEIRLQVASILG